MSAVPFPSGPIGSHRGRGLPLIGADIDTDRIIPARYLKCISFSGLADAVFADDRQETPGEHPFDHPAYQQASVLVVNSNFGCGSSREHAPQALMRWGIRAIVGESFAEIFFGNCLALGIPCLSAPHDTILALQQWAEARPQQLLELDLASLQLRVLAEEVAASGSSWSLSLDAGPHTMLLSGQWDATGQLLAHDDDLKATAARLPYLAAFAA